MLNSLGNITIYFAKCSVRLSVISLVSISRVVYSECFYVDHRVYRVLRPNFILVLVSHSCAIILSTLVVQNQIFTSVHWTDLLGPRVLTTGLFA